MNESKPRKYHPQKTRKAIIDAGLSLLDLHGYHGTSVDKIAKDAGITKGAFYHHFKSKEELLALIHQEYAEYQLKAMEEVLDRNLSSEDQLRALVVSIVEAVGLYKPNVTVFFHERRYLTEKYLKQTTKQRDRLEKAFRRVIEEGMRSGEFRQDLDSKVTCLGIIGMCAWMYQWFSPDGRLSASDVADTFSSLLIDGLVA